MKGLIFLCLFLHAAMLGIGQRICGTSEFTDVKVNTQLESDESFALWINQNKKKTGSQSKRAHQSAYDVRIVVHVIHNGEVIGSGTNISTEQIHSQIEVLNKDFTRSNEDASDTPEEFQRIAGFMNIRFSLATVAPDGTPTDGINRVRGVRDQWTINEDKELKSLSYWPAEDYINIWVCNLEDYYGYTQFPVSTLPGVSQTANRLTDGIIMNYKVFGSDDYGDFELLKPYNKGRAATHEMGHFFGLRHVWGDIESCGGTDYVDDTPPQSDKTFGCPSHPYTDCNGNRMFQNFLDFTDDACMNLFTKGQVERMTIVLENSPRRASLLLPTGSRQVPAFEKIFSPNDDGINDYWRWENTLAYEGCKLSIYNRFGKLVYQKLSYDNSWNGSSNDGQQLEAEAYYFVINCDDKPEIRGGVRIVR